MIPLEALPALDKFYTELTFTDDIKVTYDVSNYTRSHYNEYATRLFNNKIQVFGKAYVETALSVDEIVAVIKKTPAEIDPFLERLY